MIKSLLLTALTASTILAAAPAQAGQMCSFRNMQSTSGTTRCDVISVNGKITGFAFPDSNELITGHMPGFKFGGMQSQCVVHIQSDTYFCPIF